MSVTGTVDEVDDLIVPGAYGATLAHRKPKGVKAHDWKIDVARVLHAEEWMPGDRRLPKVGPDGKPWPRDAGALVVTLQYNMAVQRARDEWEMVKFYAESGEACFSIGYRVAPGKASKRSDGVRVIYELELFEISSVLHGAHPGTMALDVKHHGGPVEWKATTAYWGAKTIDSTDSADGEAGGPTVAGVAVRAADTGRVLMLQRALTEDDPAAGTWEFPGGHVEGGEDALEGGRREWCEETGMPFPDGELAGQWDSPNGVYRGHVWSVPREQDVEINPDHEDRTVLNPDDPDGDEIETVAWWDPDHLDDNPAVRAELGDQLGRVRRALRSGKKAAARALMQAKAMPVPVRRGPRTDAESLAMGGRDDVSEQREDMGLPPIDAKDGDKGTCPCGTPAVYDDTDGWQHADGSVSHDDGESVAEKMQQPEGEAGSGAKHDRGGKTYPGTSAKAAVAAARGLETKTVPYIPGSFEYLRGELDEAARDLLFPPAGGDGDRGWVSITATFPDRIIVDASGAGGSCESYAIPYEMLDGRVQLGTPTRVDVIAVAVPDSDAAADGEPAGEDAEVQARFVAPALASLKAATGRLAMSPLSGKALEVSVRAGVLALLDEMAVKGADVANMVMGADDDPEDVLDGGADEDTEDDAAPPKPTSAKGMPPSLRKPTPPPGASEDDPEDAADGGTDEDTEADDLSDGDGGSDAAATGPGSGPASAGDGDPEDATDGGADEDEEDSRGRVILSREDLTKQLLELNAE